MVSMPLSFLQILEKTPTVTWTLKQLNQIIRLVARLDRCENYQRRTVFFTTKRHKKRPVL